VKGARAGLQLAQVGSGLSYVLLGVSTSIPMLFASRIPTLFMHSMHCCQAFIAGITLPDTRSVGMGRLVISCTFHRALWHPRRGCPHRLHVSCRWHRSSAWISIQWPTVVCNWPGKRRDCCGRFVFRLCACERKCAPTVCRRSIFVVL
jgi:hypothetical protein